MAVAKAGSERKLGYVFDGQTGFRLPNKKLRSPDLSFVASTVLPEGVPRATAPQPSPGANVACRTTGNDLPALA